MLIGPHDDHAAFLTIDGAHVENIVAIPWIGAKHFS